MQQATRDLGWFRKNGKEKKSDRCGRVCKERDDGNGRMIKSSALPEPKVFDGTGEFGEFKRTFLLKYGQVTNSDDELVAILEDKFLKGAAKSLLNSLLERYGRSITSLFAEFQAKLRKRQRDSKAEALNKFDGLRREKPEEMWEYLIEMRITKLMMAARDDDTLHRMTKRLEIPLRYQYEELKDIVLQQENEKQRAIETVQTQNVSVVEVWAT
uniref:Uncharacterized protein n=1 Tax=Caenorhabditis japonica TaxID=281687 RepID=A0A8R1E9K9_CAEJA